MSVKRRSFRVYAEKDDLQDVFTEFQHKLEIYYVPTYSDTGEIYYNSILEIENLGINFFGSHVGNRQMLILPKTVECLWRIFQYMQNDGREGTRYSSLDAGNTACIFVDLNGVYQDSSIFPTEIHTINYDDSAAKLLYDELRKVFRKRSVKTVRGFYVCPKAYEHKENYRFCTIDVKSPAAYDLKIE